MLDPEGTAAPPLQKTRDRIRVDVFCSAVPGGPAAPYARFGLLMNAAPSEALLTEEGKVLIRGLDGRTDDLFIPANAILRDGRRIRPGPPAAWRGRERSHPAVAGRDARRGGRPRPPPEPGSTSPCCSTTTRRLTPSEYHEAPNFDQQGRRGQGAVASAATVDPTIDWRKHDPPGGSPTAGRSAASSTSCAGRGCTWGTQVSQRGQRFSFGS